jgi:ELWxxDGT repeat protein
MENGALWKSDGTPAGTVEIKASATSEMISLLRLLTSVGDKLFFIANDSWDPDLSLWVSDGTNAGTVKLTTIAARDDYVEPFHMTDVNGMLFFVLYDNGGATRASIRPA